MCCGENQSISNVARELGWETLTLDSNPKCRPDVVADIREWDYRQYSNDHFDVVWGVAPVRPDIHT